MLKDIYKTEQIIKVGLEDTLSHIVSLFSSSHDVAFVMDEGGNLKGVVNPYYCMIKKSYPANTKAKHCMIHPPRIDINAPVKKVAALMIESKLHYLPVYKAKQFIGIISVRRILKIVQDSQNAYQRLGDFVKGKKPLVSLMEHDTLAKALSFFKTYGVSKLLILSRSMKIKGIVSYFDLISFLVIPREKQHFSSREGNKQPFLKKDVATVMKLAVVTVKSTDLVQDAIDLMIKKHIGSVIVIDKEDHPIGMVTTRDILVSYVGRRTFLPIELATKNLSLKSQRLVNLFMSHLALRVAKLKDISKARFFIREGKGGGLFEGVFALFSRKKEPIKLIRQEGKNLTKVLKTIEKKT